MKTSREIANWAPKGVAEELGRLLLAAKAKDIPGYQASMRTLGGQLGAELRPKLPARGDVLVVLSVEDADYLGQGVVDALRLGDRLRVFCYWNERNRQLDLASIVSRYEEPLHEPAIAAVVVVKSIIATACVVRTNLIEALERILHPVPVFVVAPVMHAGARKALEAEFPAPVASRFQYVVCAIDSKREGDLVVPGVGGSVYELLGLGDSSSKNRVWPALVEQRSTHIDVPPRRARAVVAARRG